VRRAISSNPSCSLYRIKTIARSISGSCKRAETIKLDCSSMAIMFEGDSELSEICRNAVGDWDWTLRHSLIKCLRRPSVSLDRRICNSQHWNSPSELPRKLFSPWQAESMVSWTRSDSDIRVRKRSEIFLFANCCSIGRKESSKRPIPEGRPLRACLSCSEKMGSRGIEDIATYGSSRWECLTIELQEPMYRNGAHRQIIFEFIKNA
jgi:hypothetical protein